MVNIGIWSYLIREYASTDEPADVIRAVYNPNLSLTKSSIQWQISKISNKTDVNAESQKNYR